MIPLNLPSHSEGEEPFVARLSKSKRPGFVAHTLELWQETPDVATFSGPRGLVSIEGANDEDLDGDVVLVHPGAGRTERLLRSGSRHNTLLVTERCDQLCVMCSQPPKKTHVDRFAIFEEACLLSEPNIVIGISGGEPTLYKEQLFSLIERVLDEREDLAFHILSNGQHFTADDVPRMRDPRFRRVTWGIPLYATEPVLHDSIVGKPGAFERLEESFAHLLYAGARVELRTVLVEPNAVHLPALARYVATRLRFIEIWSIMQLENIGFARNRWSELYINHAQDFGYVGQALDHAKLHGIPARLFNFPRCTVPEPYRYLAAASISDWKRKYVEACQGCSARSDCCGFFEWHPDTSLEGVCPL